MSSDCKKLECSTTSLGLDDGQAHGHISEMFVSISTHLIEGSSLLRLASVDGILAQLCM